MINGYKVEVCIGNITDGINASRFPIDRLEVNSALELSGLTPSLSTIRMLKKKTSIPLCCMCRVRPGDFCYDENEYETMFSDAKMMLEENVDGIVFGFLNEDKSINIEKTEKMVQLIHSYHKTAVFHKAFDELADLEKGIQTLIELKVDRVLTNGSGDSDLLAGCQRLADLVKKYGNQIEILPGGGVRIDNVQQVLKITGCRQVHGSCKCHSGKGYNQFEPKQLKQMLEKISEL